MVRLSCPLTGTSKVEKPTKETSRIVSAGALMLKFPSKSVEIPFYVPFTTTVATSRGPSSLVTIQDTF